MSVEVAEPGKPAGVVTRNEAGKQAVVVSFIPDEVTTSLLLWWLSGC